MTSNTTPHYDDVDWDYVHELRDVEIGLTIYVLGFLILFGVVGNVLSIGLMQTKAFRQQRSAAALCCLGLADIGALLSSALLWRWVTAVTGYDVDLTESSAAACKLLTFASQFFLLLSAWTSVLVSLEKMITVRKPARVHVLLSRKRIVLAWIITIASLLVLDLFVLILYDLHDQPVLAPIGRSNTRCGFPLDNTDVLNDTFRSINMVMGFLFPSLGIIIFNWVTIATLSKRSGGQVTVSTDGGRKKNKANTTLLVVISAVFIVCVLPMRLCELFTHEWFRGRHSNPETDAQYRLVTGCLAILYFINNAINMILHAATSSGFRGAFRRLYCPCWTSSSPGGAAPAAESISITEVAPVVPETGAVVKEVTAPSMGSEQV